MDQIHGPAQVSSRLRAPLYKSLETSISSLRPKCVVLDTRADVFGGNEISRVQVRSFVRSLRRLAVRYDCAIVMLSHPSVSGMASGSGQSGSTGWGNSVRSRLYLTAPKADSDSDPDPDIRVLAGKKSNYGPRDAEIVLRWSDGMFRPNSRTISDFDRASQDHMVEVRFLQLLYKLEGQGRTANSSSGPNYAPKLMTEIDGTYTKRKYKNAMERLFTDEMITNLHQGRSYRIVLTEDGMKKIDVHF